MLSNFKTKQELLKVVYNCIGPPNKTADEKYIDKINNHIS
jgi:hypothetical protein